MKKHGMPYRPEDIGIAKTDEVFFDYYEKLCASSAIESEDESIRLEKSLKYLWEIK